MPDRAIAVAELAEELRGETRRLLVLGDGGQLCRDGLAQLGVESELAPAQLLYQNAVGVGLAAEHGTPVSAQELAPVYLRISQAERERNARLQQENQLLSMQQQRYESLKAAIEEARQARHDLRHQLCQLAALAEEGNLEKIKAYLSGAVSRIPSLELHFCENRAADGVVGYYCALAKREQIPFSVQIDLPECLPVDEIDLCLVLSNLLENALEASLRTAPARRRIELTAYLHGNSLALIQVENTYDGVIREKDGVFLSSKRKGDGVGIQSVRHIAEKSGGVSTVTYQDGLFCAKVMLRR